MAQRRPLVDAADGDGRPAVPPYSVRPVRKVPTAGVRWEGDDLIPPGVIRRCKICHQPIEHLDKRRVCCSHPRCQRANRNNKKYRPGTNKRVRRGALTAGDHYRREAEEKDRALRLKIVKGYEYARSRGADESTALAWVSKNVGLSIIQVQSILREKE